MGKTDLNWRARYRDKIRDAAGAVRIVRHGQHVFVGSGAACPAALVEALAERRTELADVEILHLLTLGNAPYAHPEALGAFRHNALFIGSNVREAVAEGRADYTPVFLSEIPRLFRNGRLCVDVALIQVSPPDEHGYCSLGVSIDIVKAATEAAEVIVAEVNPRMPRTLGDGFIHTSRLAAMVPVEHPLFELPTVEPDDEALEIGRHVATLVEDGATIQTGIGAIPSAILACLAGKTDLGVHTEMFTDAVADLIEAGAVTCAKKTANQGKVVASFCMGSRRLYDYVDDNPLFEFRGSDYVNDPFVIAAHDRMTAVNAAVELDLTGQICSDSIGDKYFSGIGGQVDFIRGAARARKGKPIIAIRSTACGGAVSRIVPHLREGAGVVTTRGDVHYVVTEYGVADLWGKSVRERALALITIAHPKFRAELIEAAKRRRLLFEDQPIPPAEYPENLECSEAFGGVGRIQFRAIRPTDEPLMRDLFYACSPETIYHRFFSAVKAMPHARLQDFVNVDYDARMCIVAVVQDGEAERIVAVARYTVDRSTGLADVAFLVRDDHQGRGIGTFLLRRLMRIAVARGVLGFTADVLADNRAMLHVFHKSGCKIESSLAGGVYHLEFLFGLESTGGRGDAAGAASDEPNMPVSRP